MASLDRAYGLRGAILALGLAAAGGAIHGTLAGTEPGLIAKLGLALASLVVVLVAGVASARRSLGAALGIAALILAAFLVCRWGCWCLMVADWPGLARLAALPPGGWPGALAGLGAGALAVVETTAVATAALVGCLTGQERED